MVTRVPRGVGFVVICRVTVTRGGAVIARSTPPATVGVVASWCGVRLIVSGLRGFVGIIVRFIVIW